MKKKKERKGAKNELCKYQNTYNSIIYLTHLIDWEPVYISALHSATPYPPYYHILWYEDSNWCLNEGVDMPNDRWKSKVFIERTHMSDKLKI